MLSLVSSLAEEINVLRFNFITYANGTNLTNLTNTKIVNPIQNEERESHLIYVSDDEDLEEDSDVAYRYDGLYMVRAVWDIHGHETETYPVTGENGWQTYFCTRLPRRPLEEEKREEGVEYNAMGCQELWSTIQKMRGVRKPKKFDIPPPPVKLGPLRKCAISGAYKDRKAVGFVKPTGETQFVAPPRQRRPKSKSPRAIPMEENDEDDDDNESKSNIVCLQQQQHQTNQLSSSSSLKVMTQRPRLNSTMSFESNNASPSPRHVDAESDDEEEWDDDYDSEDDEDYESEETEDEDVSVSSASSSEDEEGDEEGGESLVVEDDTRGKHGTTNG
jgi:hypothetical protein